MSDDNEKRERVQITTSAVLNKKQQEQVIKELEELEEHQKEQRRALEESKSLKSPKFLFLISFTEVIRPATNTGID